MIPQDNTRATSPPKLTDREVLATVRTWLACVDRLVEGIEPPEIRTVVETLLWVDVEDEEILFEYEMEWELAQVNDDLFTPPR